MITHRKVVTLNWSAPASGGWWDLNGTITSCVAAYQSKGAASYAASKVNLVNASTYPLTDGAGIDCPSWNTDDGWICTSASDRSSHLVTSITPTNAYTVIARYKSLSAGGNYMIGTRSDDDKNFAFAPYSNTYANRDHFWQATSVDKWKGSYLTYGVIALAGVYCYSDGALKLTLADTQSVNYQYPFFIGTFNIKGTRALNSGVNGHICAVAFYNTTLTGTQIAALTTAMNEL